MNRRTDGIDRGRGLKRNSAERAADVGPPDEADLRVELFTDAQAFELHAVAVAREVELRAIAGVAAAHAVRLGARPVGVDRQVVEEVERRRPHRRRCSVRCRPARPSGAVTRAPTLLSRRMSRRSRTTEKFVACAPAVGDVVGLDVQRAESVTPDTPGQAAAGVDRHGPSGVEPDAPAVEEHRRVAAAAGDAAKRERVAVLQEELALLRERTG